jgi:hypothetical protein
MWIDFAISASDDFIVSLAVWMVSFCGVTYLQRLSTKSYLLCLWFCSRNFYDKRISQEVDGEVLGDDFKGYVFRCVSLCPHEEA